LISSTFSILFFRVMVLLFLSGLSNRRNYHDPLHFAELFGHYPLASTLFAFYTGPPREISNPTHSITCRAHPENRAYYEPVAGSRQHASTFHGPSSFESKIVKEEREMHHSSILRMQWFLDHYASRIPHENVRVLDVGSYDVNGSYKHLFGDPKYHYTGLDMAEGPNVDIVLRNPYDWHSIESDSFDVVISGQAFEHIEFFWKIMEEMTRVLKKGGLLCLIAPNGFPEHRYPVDCYRFFTDGMLALARYVSIEPLHAHTNCAPSEKADGWYSESSADSMLIARKPYDGLPQHPDFKSYICVPEKHKRFRGDLLPYHRLKGVKRLIYKIRNRLL
ncbi:MAG: methyltransferase domain-containing protein, partial [Verrucomicrobia bacterium]|nr:methyltransferase domain-containing protein [Verrucomicrobiota bacterium]